MADILSIENTQDPLNTQPLVFWKTADYLMSAIVEIQESARRDIEDTYNRLLPLLHENPDCSLSNWSMRVSAEGFEVVNAELEDWLQGRDYSRSAYLHAFSERDKLARLLSIIVEHREDLVLLLQRYILKEVGLDLLPIDNQFVCAIEEIASQHLAPNAVRSARSDGILERPVVDFH